MSESLVNSDAIRIPLANESVQMVCASPPFYGLRSYNIGDQKDAELGTELLHDCGGAFTGNYCNECYVCHTLQWTREVWRILRKDGIFFLQLGDSYSGSGGQGSQFENKHSKYIKENFTKYKNVNRNVQGLPPKNLMGIPWRCALALQNDGWILRNDNIWYSPNKMPESVVDRCSKGHEYIFMFAKSNKYFFDHIAIKEKSTTNENRPHAIVRDRENDYNSKQKQIRNQRDSFKRVNNKVLSGQTAQKRTSRKESSYDLAYRNKRTVWTINTKPYKGSHHAVFPYELPEICIKASTSEHGACSNCGSPYKRVVDRTFNGEYNDKEALKQLERMDGVIGGGKDRVTLGRTESVSNKTVGWERTCTCQTDEIRSCVVLDPFCGSGTSLLAARDLGRTGIGLDLSFHYLNNDAKNRLGIAKKDQWLQKAEVVVEENQKTMFDKKE